jgi:hypothetical protein
MKRKGVLGFVFVAVALSVGVGAHSASADELADATQQMQETQNSANLRYLHQQAGFQTEQRIFAVVAQVAKTKHDTAKNSISNVR